MFDRDLQEVIEKENKEFLAQATERAAEVEMEPGKVALSPLGRQTADGRTWGLLW